MAKSRHTKVRSHGNPEPSALHAKLAARILRSLHEDGAAVGHHLVEQVLCRRLGVSRTPVRGALKLLAEQGCVEPRANRGCVLLKPVAVIADGAPIDPHDEDDKQLFIEIIRSRNSGKLATEVAQQDVVRLFGAKLSTVMRVLRRMSELGLVQRKAGIGWSFMPCVDSSQTRAESYAFRRAIEPTMLVQPTFELDLAWARRSRERHLEFRHLPWRNTLAVKFYEMNSDFHEQLARCSGNRYMLSAVQRQIQLRTFMNYQWEQGVERVQASIDEHLDILSALEANRHQDAAVIMQAHLLASRERSEASAN